MQEAANQSRPSDIAQDLERRLQRPPVRLFVKKAAPSKLGGGTTSSKKGEKKQHAKPTGAEKSAPVIGAEIKVAKKILPWIWGRR